MDSARKSVVAVISTVLIVLAVSITYGLVASARAPATTNQASYTTTGYTTPYGMQNNYGSYGNSVNGGYGYGEYGYGGSMMGGGMMGGYGGYGYGGYGIGMP